MKNGSKRRSDLIEKYGEGAFAFDRFLSHECAAELLDYRPAVEGAWTIREHLVHAVDAEVNAFIRYRTCIADPGKRICTFDEDKWHRALGYADQPLEESLSLFRLLRGLAHRHLKTLDPAAWKEYFVVHPEKGKYGLDDWLLTYTSHVDVHSKYIERNVALWEAERQGGCVSTS